MHRIEKYTSILLLIVILGVAVCNGKTAYNAAYSAAGTLVRKRSIGAAVSTFDTNYKSALDDARYWVNAYGGLQRLLGKREFKNFQIVSDAEGSLYKQSTPYTNEKIEQIVEDIRVISEYAENRKIGFLFVQVPYKNFSDESSLLGYGMDYTEENYNAIVERLYESRINVLDLREKKEKWEFYKTDHHWTVESAFDATVMIVEELNAKTDLSLDTGGMLRNKEYYDILSYPESLLGSAGIQVGPYYSGMDDFNVLIPNFETDLEYRHYIKDELTLEACGQFEKAFITTDLLEDETYYNKYNACLHGGYVEGIVENNNSENELKCLFVSHSYGRPLVQYLSLYFRETRYLDPQKGRYNESIINYIKEYEPDVVILMYNDEMNVEE